MTIRWGTGDPANWVLSVRWQREHTQPPEEGISLSPLQPPDPSGSFLDSGGTDTPLPLSPVLLAARMEIRALPGSRYNVGSTTLVPLLLPWISQLKKCARGQNQSPACCSCIMWMHFLDSPILPPLYLYFLHSSTFLSSNTAALYGSPKQHRRTGSWALRKLSGRQKKALPNQTCSR